jgi:peptidoglycan hydrolase CwlO-like protein
MTPSMNRRLRHMPQKLTPEIIAAAIAGFEFQKTQLDHQIAELRSMLDGNSRTSAATQSETGKGKRKRFSLASRRKMAAAQKARWKKIKQTSEPSQAASSKPAKRKRRKMSAAGKAAIAAAVKKRWAAIRAAKKVA